MTIIRVKPILLSRTKKKQEKSAPTKCVLNKKEGCHVIIVMRNASACPVVCYYHNLYDSIGMILREKCWRKVPTEKYLL